MSESAKSSLPRIPLAVQLGAALVLGALAGLVLGERAQPLGEVAALVIKLLKALAGPLVFFAILDAFATTSIAPRRGLKLLAISFMNACVAATIALLLANALPLGRDARATFAATTKPAAAASETLSYEKVVGGLVPQSLVEPFLTGNALGIVLLALLFGAALRALPASDERVALERFVRGAFRLLALLLGWVVHLVPIAAFAILAKVVGTSGLDVFRALVKFVALVSLGIFIHAGVYYAALLWGVTRTPPWRFYPQALEALLTAFSTGSSLATLPVTLRTLERMEVSPESARLAACVGTNLNHDGILLYEAMAALFVSQAVGHDLTLAQQAWVVVTSTLAAVGIAGVPDAGFITLTLVLGSVGLPVEVAPLLLPVDWFLGRLRASANVTSDLVVARLLDHPGGVQGSRS